MDSFVTFRCSSTDKVGYSELAKRFGYEDVSDFMRAMMLAMTERYDRTEQWESRLVHLVEDRVIVDDHPSAVDPSPDLCAFQIAAPGHFWRYLDRIRDVRRFEQEQEEQEARTAK